MVVLDINKDKQEISLGMKQTEVNPWDLVAEKYPPGTVVEGKVRNLATYGAFVEIEPGFDGLLHVSDLSWTKKLTHPNEMLKKGDSIKCVVLEVDQGKQRVALGLKQMTRTHGSGPSRRHLPAGHDRPGQGDQDHSSACSWNSKQDLEGPAAHLRSLADHKVENPHGGGAGGPGCGSPRSSAWTSKNGRSASRSSGRAVDGRGTR